MFYIYNLEARVCIREDNIILSRRVLTPCRFFFNTDLIRVKLEQYMRTIMSRNSTARFESEMF